MSASETFKYFRQPFDYEIYREAFSTFFSRPYVKSSKSRKVKSLKSMVTLTFPKWHKGASVWHVCLWALFRTSWISTSFNFCMTGCLARDYLSEWLTNRLCDRLTEWLTYRPTDWQSEWVKCRSVAILLSHSHCRTLWLCLTGWLSDCPTTWLANTDRLNKQCIFICTHSRSKKEITTMKILKVNIRVLAAQNNYSN